MDSNLISKLPKDLIKNKKFLRHSLNIKKNYIIRPIQVKYFISFKEPQKFKF